MTGDLKRVFLALCNRWFNLSVKLLMAYRSTSFNRSSPEIKMQVIKWFLPHLWRLSSGAIISLRIPADGNQRLGTGVRICGS